MNNIFERDNCLNQLDLKAYINQTLKEDQLHKIERHLIDCPLCSSAVEGLKHVEDIDQELQENAYNIKLRNSSKAEENPDRSYECAKNEYDMAAEPSIQRHSYRLG